jgi:flagellin
MSSVQFNGTSLFTTTSDFTFQVGANVGQTVTVGSADLGVASGAITGVLPNSGAASSLDPLVNANNSANISALDDALAAVNSSRATLGAVQSRFSQTITYLQTAVENQTAARGRIMDADFAAETANLSRAQILQQAGTAMIAQANQMPQSVLQLLK